MITRCRVCDRFVNTAEEPVADYEPLCEGCVAWGRTALFKIYRMWRRP